MALLIKTFLRRPTQFKFSLENIKPKPKRYFKDVTEDIDKNQTLDHYSRGVILIDNNDQRVIDFVEHDLIFPLWWSFLVGLDEYLNDGFGELVFQDMALKLCIKKHRDEIVIEKIGGLSRKMGHWKINNKLFLNEMVSSAESFYHSIQHFDDSQDLNEEIQLIKELKKRI